MTLTTPRLVLRHFERDDLPDLFAMDRERTYRRLIRVSGGAYNAIAADDVVYEPDSDMTITIEAESR